MIRTRLKNWRLRRRRRKLEGKSAEIRKKSKELKNKEIYEKWYIDNGWEYEAIDLQIKHNVSQALLERADQLNLPTPDPYEKDNWVEYTHDILSPKGMNELRTAIREEERDQREAIEAWARILGTVIAILTGLIGALIGLIALLK